MREPTPAKAKATPAPRDALARTTGTAEVRVAARFYRRMKPQRVYPLVVKLQGSTAAAAPVFVQAVVPGASVTPQEVTLDPAVPGDKGTFYVTPLAKGKLPKARLDVFYQGRLLQEVPLSMRSSTQCLTWLLAALTVLVPAFLLYSTVFSPLTGSVPKTVVIPAGAEGDGPAVPEKLEKEPKEEKGPPAEQGGAEEQEPQAGPGKGQEGGDKPNDAGKPQGGRGRPEPVEDAPAAVRTRTIFLPGAPGELLAQRIINNVPDLPDTVKLPWSDEPLAVTRPLAEGLGTAYTYAVTMKDTHLSFWVGVGLLAMTIGSAIIHRPWRARCRSKPLALGTG